MPTSPQTLYHIIRNGISPVSLGRVPRDKYYNQNFYFSEDKEFVLNRLFHMEDKYPTEKYEIYETHRMR